MKDLKYFLYVGVLLSATVIICCGAGGRKAESEEAVSLGDELIFERGDMTLTIDRHKGKATTFHFEDEEDKADFLAPRDQAEERLLGTIYCSYRAGEEEEWTMMKPENFRVEHEVSSGEDFDSVTFNFASDESLMKFNSTFSLDDEGVLSWEIRGINSSRQTLELGELGFPLPFNNNYYSGFSQTDEGMRRLFESRFYVNRFIGGSSSYVLLKRLNAEYPALYMLTGKGTSLEFSHQLLVGWEGIPCVYVHSEAVKDRYGMREDWLNGHTSLSLSAGESRTWSLRFIPIKVNSGRIGKWELEQKVLANVLTNNGKIWMRSFPGMVVPTDCPAVVQAVSADPFQDLSVDGSVKMEHLVNQPTYRIVRLIFEKPGYYDLEAADESGETCRIHFKAVEPLRTKIEKRAKFIAEKQLYRNEGHVLDGAILVYDNQAEQPLVDPSSYWGGGGYEGGITDALFLAEKNAIHPDKEQIKVLEEYTDDFLMNRLQNPGTFEVAWFFLPGKVPYKIGRPYNYCHVHNFHYSMYKIGRRYGLLHNHTAREYLEYAYRTAERMFMEGWWWHLYHVGFMHYSTLYDLTDVLRKEGMEREADRLEALLIHRGETLLQHDYPYSAEPLYDTTGYEDVYFTAKYLKEFDMVIQTAECSMAQKSYVPTWFWCGSDKRYWDAMENNPGGGWYGTDHGETAMHYTTTQTALIGLDKFEHPKFFPEDVYFYKSYAGLLGVWSLVDEEGKASMCYTPDASSNHYGYNRYSGDSGLGLYGYLRAAGAYVDLIRIGSSRIEVGFGCRISQEGEGRLHAVIADGINKRFRYPQFNFFADTEKTDLTELTMERNRTYVRMTLKNQLGETLMENIRIRGFWGEDYVADIDGVEQKGSVQDGVLRHSLEVPPEKSVTVTFTRTG